MAGKRERSKAPNPSHILGRIVLDGAARHGTLVRLRAARAVRVSWPAPAPPPPCSSAPVPGKDPLPAPASRLGGSMDEEGQVERTQRAGRRKESDYARPRRALGILAHHVGHHSSATPFRCRTRPCFRECCAAVLKALRPSASCRARPSLACRGLFPGGPEGQLGPLTPIVR